MNGDAVGAARQSQHGGGHRIRLPAAPSLPYRGYMINVYAQSNHCGSSLKETNILPQPRLEAVATLPKSPRLRKCGHGFLAHALGQLGQRLPVANQFPTQSPVKKEA